MLERGGLALDVDSLWMSTGVDGGFLRPGPFDIGLRDRIESFAVGTGDVVLEAERNDRDEEQGKPG
jgi:hypothetical protein